MDIVSGTPATDDFARSLRDLLRDEERLDHDPVGTLIAHLAQKGVRGEVAWLQDGEASPVLTEKGQRLST